MEKKVEKASLTPFLSSSFRFQGGIPTSNENPGPGAYFAPEDKVEIVLEGEKERKANHYFKSQSKRAGFMPRSQRTRASPSRNADSRQVRARPAEPRQEGPALPQRARRPQESPRTLRLGRAALQRKNTRSARRGRRRGRPRRPREESLRPAAHLQGHDQQQAAGPRSQARPLRGGLQQRGRRALTSPSGSSRSTKRRSPGPVPTTTGGSRAGTRRPSTATRTAKAITSRPNDN